MKNNKNKNKDIVLKVLEGDLVSVVYNSDGTFTIKLWNNEELNPFTDLQLDDADVDKENIKQAQLYLVYSNAYALSVLQKSRLENQLAVLSSELDEQFRNMLKDQGEKITETALKRMIASNPEYVKLNDKLAELTSIQILCKEILNAFVHKREALFHFSASGRILMRGHLESLKKFAEGEKDYF